MYQNMYGHHLSSVQRDHGVGGGRSWLSCRESYVLGRVEVVRVGVVGAGGGTPVRRERRTMWKMAQTTGQTKVSAALHSIEHIML